MATELSGVLLELGKAVYICQAFEGTFVFLLSLISQEEANHEDGAFTAAIDLYSQKTLGQLLKRLGEKIDLPKEIQKCLEIGWDRRNAIVHRFIHEHIQLFMEPKGRLEAENALVRYKLEVKRADVVANRLLDTMLDKYGITVADLKANADRLWKHLNSTGEMPH